MMNLKLSKGAIFSEDRKYRYSLWRNWDPICEKLLFIGLNPSNANEIKDDPTITRCMRRAVNGGFGGLIVANLYAYVSSIPDVLLGEGDFVGEENDLFLKYMIGISGQVLCGWGSFKPVKQRASKVLEMIKEPYCLGVNADGQPKHPLYIGYKIPMIKYLPIINKEGGGDA